MSDDRGAGDRDRPQPSRVERILERAVASGVVTPRRAEDTLAGLRADILAGRAPADPEPSMVLHDTGVLDSDTLARMVRELGLDYEPPPRPGLPPDPFDGPPVRDWDRYELIEFIGRGGMGDVWKAVDPRLGRPVALKFLRRDDPQLTERFAREARIQARIDHDNVCPVFEVGSVQGLSYIAMQYVAGGSLKDVRDLLDLRTTVEIMVDVADALHAAHQQGMVHRDVKPANVLLERTPDGDWRPFVVDFGIARDLAADDLTVSGVVLGTPAFSAPEQVRGDTRRIDPRTDVYSLGATMYWLLTGRPPFDGGYPEIVSGVADREPVPPHRLDRAIPVDLETVVLKCLEKDPDRRYLTAREVSEDLRRFLAGEPVTARRTPLTTRLWRRIRRHPGVAATAAAALLLAGVLAAAGIRTAVVTRRQAAIAQQLLEEVQHIESLSRVTAMLPPHDRRGDDGRIRERIAGLEEEIRRLGPNAAGPGAYALGRSLLVLGELDEAAAELQRAEAAGYRTPGVAYTLGLVLGRLYERELDLLREIDDDALRDARRATLEAQLRDPALEALRRGAGDRVEVPAYVEGLIAFYEGRTGDALGHARRALEQAPWLYEAHVLAGDALVEVAVERARRGEVDGALDDLATAGDAYAAAAEIGRSDPTVYAGDCTRRTRLMEILARRGDDPTETFRGAAAACAEAERIDPASADVHARIALLRWRWADHLDDVGRDPSPAVADAVAAADRALDLEPDAARAWHSRGGALLVRALDEMDRGDDPRSTLNEAISSLEQAVASRPDWVLAHDDLGYAHARLARYELSAGRDPTSALERAIASYRRAITLEPAYANAHNNLGIALWRRAVWQRRSGDDPRPGLDAAVAAYDRALELNPGYHYAWANRGLAHRTRAALELDAGHDPSEWIERGRADLTRALELNPRIYWALPEAAAVELLAARSALAAGRDPSSALAAAAGRADAAVAANPSNPTGHQTAAEVERWRAVARRRLGSDVTEPVQAGLARTARALELNPDHAPSLLTRAALLLELAETDDPPVGRTGYAGESARAVARALELNPGLARDAAPLQARLRALGRG